LTTPLITPVSEFRSGTSPMSALVSADILAHSWNIGKEPRKAFMICGPSGLRILLVTSVLSASVCTAPFAEFNN
jgi:hypothetical protein